MDRPHHLVTQLAHAKHHDRSFQIHVCWGAEHLSQAAIDPAAENHRRSCSGRQPVGNIAQHRLVNLFVGGTHGALNPRALRPVKPAADRRAQVDGVGSCWTEPGFIATIGWP